LSLRDLTRLTALDCSRRVLPSYANECHDLVDDVKLLATRDISGVHYDEKMASPMVPHTAYFHGSSGPACYH